MRLSYLVTSLAVPVIVLYSNLIAQHNGADSKPASVQAAPVEPKPSASDSTPEDPTVEKINASAAQVKAIKDALKEEDPDWALVIGLGSLVKGPATDCLNVSNVVRSAGLGHATPELLAGVWFRSHVPNIIPRYRVKPEDRLKCDDSASATEKCPLALWQRRPWNGFVSLKFSPGASQVLNGYVYRRVLRDHALFECVDWLCLDSRELMGKTAARHPASGP